jgi:hypothetical protein
MPCSFYERQSESFTKNRLFAKESHSGRTLAKIPDPRWPRSESRRRQATIWKKAS